MPQFVSNYIILEEEQQKAAFWKLQNDIYTMYGIQKPVAPELKVGIALIPYIR
jgi:hypothetical protein